MTLESLTLQQIVRFSNSGDIDVAQFGRRAARLMQLAINTTDEDICELRDLDKVLRANLANPAFVAWLQQDVADIFKIALSREEMQ